MVSFVLPYDLDLSSVMALMKSQLGRISVINGQNVVKF